MMWPPVLAFIVSFAILLLLLNTRLAKLGLDRPNHRSLHTKVTPRTGGLAIMSGLIVALIAVKAWFWIMPLLALLTISLLDDVTSLPVRWRLLMHLTVSSVVTLLVFPGAAPWLCILLVVTMVWMINLYNFMDGSDGLAGGMAIFGFGSYAIAAWLIQNPGLTTINASIAAASMAFLLFNFYPARIFLGDAGSVPLGFLAGAMGLYGWQQDVWPAWFPLLVFSPFISDATVTLIRRGLRGEKIWQAHRSHYYQRLVQMGWGHRKTALAAYVLMLATALSAIWMLDSNGLAAMILLGAWLLIYAALFQWIDRQWRIRQR